MTTDTFGALIGGSPLTDVASNDRRISADRCLERVNIPKSQDAPSRQSLTLCPSRRPARIWRGIDGKLLEELVAANTGKKVIAFTHKPVLGDDSISVKNR